MQARVALQAARYRELVQLLREYPGRQQRWLVLALWLMEEGICRPIDFLPPQIYKNLTDEKRAELRVSITIFSTIIVWKPGSHISSGCCKTAAR